MSSVDYISHGPALIYLAPYGETVPADTVGPRVAWGGNWVQVGWTESPLKLTYEYDVANADIQEALSPVAAWKKAEKMNWETALAELTMANLAYAIEGAATVVAAGAGVHGYTDLKVGGADTLTVRAWGFEFYETISGTEYPIRCFVWRGTSVAGASLEGKKDGQQVIALKGAALADMTKTQGQRLFQMHHITAEPAS